MAAYVELAGFIFQMAFLAIILTAAGWAVNKFINALIAARRDEQLRQAAMVAAARARANARRQGI